MKLKQKIVVIINVIFGLAFFSTVFAVYGDTKTWLSRPYSGDGGSPHAAYLDFPEDVVFDNQGRMYIADTMNNAIRKIENGKITTIAGTGSYGDGQGKANLADLAQPKGVAVDGKGNVYVADTGNHKVKKVSGGNIVTLVDGLSYPEGVAVFGKTLFIADTKHNIIKKVSTNGKGMAIVASGILSPKKIAVDKNGKYLYVVESGRYRVVKIDISSGNVSLVAGFGEAGYKEGKGSEAKFRNIVGVALDNSQNTLFVTDGDGFTDMLRAIDLRNFQTSLVSIDKVMATINYPKGAVVFGDYVYVANSGIGTIHRFYRIRGKWETGTAEYVAGKERFGNSDGPRKKAILGRPYDMVFSPKKKFIYLAENNKIRKINYKTGRVSWLIGNSVDMYVEGTRDKARFSFISSITRDKKGENLYIADHWNNRIRKINLKNLTTSLVSGGGAHSVSSPVNGYHEGVKEKARFNLPSGVAISKNNKFLYVTDTANQRIRRVKISNGKTKLLAGSGAVGFKDGKGKTAAFYNPWGITIDKSGKNLYIADRDNHAIRKLNIKTKTVTTIAGCGKGGYLEGIGRTACFSYPEYLKIGHAGNIYISEVGGHRIRVLTIKTGEVKLVAGSGFRGYRNGQRKLAKFNNPKGLLPDVKRGRLFIADTWNDVIRKISIKGKAPYTNPRPEVHRVGPDNKYKVGSYGIIMLYIRGNNFRYGAKTYFGKQEAIRTYVNSEKEVTVKFDFGKLSPGYYDVTVKNVDGQTYTLKNGFIVLNGDGSLPSKKFSYH
jgi:DNA-binding beta-propeller fold protein YncE